MERQRRHQLVYISLSTGLIAGGVWLAIAANKRAPAITTVTDTTQPVSRSLVMKRRLEVLEAQQKTGQVQTYSYESASIPVEQPR